MGDFPQVDSASGVCLKNNPGVTTTSQQTSLLNNLLTNTAGIKNVSWVIYSPFDMETAGVNGKNIDASESDIDGNIYNWMTLNGLTRLCQKGDGDAKNCEVVMGNEQFFVPVEEHKTSNGIKASLVSAYGMYGNYPTVQSYLENMLSLGYSLQEFNKVAQAHHLNIRFAINSTEGDVPLDYLNSKDAKWFPTREQDLQALNQGKSVTIMYRPMMLGKVTFNSQTQKNTPSYQFFNPNSKGAFPVLSQGYTQLTVNSQVTDSKWKAQWDQSQFSHFNQTSLGFTANSSLLTYFNTLVNWASSNSSTTGEPNLDNGLTYAAHLYPFWYQGVTTTIEQNYLAAVTAFAELKATMSTPEQLYFQTGEAGYPTHPTSDSGAYANIPGAVPLIKFLSNVKKLSQDSNSFSASAYAPFGETGPANFIFFSAFDDATADPNVTNGGPQCSNVNDNFGLFTGLDDQFCDPIQVNNNCTSGENKLDCYSGTTYFPYVPGSVHAHINIAPQHTSGYSKTGMPAVSIGPDNTLTTDTKLTDYGVEFTDANGQPVNLKAAPQFSIDSHGKLTITLWKSAQPTIYKPLTMYLTNTLGSTVTKSNPIEIYPPSYLEFVNKDQVVTKSNVSIYGNWAYVNGSADTAINHYKVSVTPSVPVSLINVKNQPVLQLKGLGLGNSYQVTVTDTAVASPYSGTDTFKLTRKNNTYIDFTMSGLTTVFYSGDSATLMGSLATYHTVDTNLDHYSVVVMHNGQDVSSKVSVIKNKETLGSKTYLKLTLGNLSNHSSPYEVKITYSQQHDSKTLPITLSYKTPNQLASFYCPSSSFVASSVNGSNIYLSALPTTQSPMQYFTALGNPIENWAIMLHGQSKTTGTILTNKQPKAGINGYKQATCTYYTQSGTMSFHTTGTWKNLGSGTENQCTQDGPEFENCLIAN
ncbi:hypothetical protein M9194_20325 [Vibrio sp. S4M6]|nr:hypothetical protein [Vibrio sinus]MCL9783775.1 hypothetical protein [Vibrio sinus]